LELEGGFIQVVDGPRFDVRVLDYRIDVERVFKRFHPQEVKAVLLVHRDGFSPTEAIQLSGIPGTIQDIEIRMGRCFEQLRLDEFLQYVDFLR
jgi:hypothetical protein